LEVITNRSKNGGPHILHAVVLTAVGLMRSPVLVHLLPFTFTVFSMLDLLFYPEDGVSRFLQNCGNDLPDYVASHLKIY
jgi:hypothetical protein